MDPIDPEEAKSLIDAAGGDTKFAELLGIEGKDGFQQRVNNWRRRGMPAAVVLEHYEVLKRLRAAKGQGAAGPESVALTPKTAVSR